jgi:hypothetical protein
MADSRIENIVITNGQSVYVFVDETNPMVGMNLLTGSFVSPALVATQIDPGFLERYQKGEVSWPPFVPNPNATQPYSPFTLNTINDYRVEYDAEYTRAQWFSDAPSRFSAIFAFESWADCLAASAAHNWSLAEVRMFRVGITLRACRVNMEILTLAREVYPKTAISKAAWEYVWRSYWGGVMDATLSFPTADGGRQDHTIGVIPELLIDGRLDLDRGWQPPS